MTCRHSPGDPECGSSPAGQARIAAEHTAIAANQARQSAERLLNEAEARVAELLSRTPNPDEYVVLDVEVVGPFLVLCVEYSSCERCSYDARKVMVVRASLRDALFWRRVDPHFDDSPRPAGEMPSPVARFPASDDGWADALAFAGMRSNLTDPEVGS